VVAAHQQRVADHLVAERAADPRLRRVPDVVEVEQQERPALARLERRLRPAESVLAQAIEVDAVLVVDAHDAGGAERTDARRAIARPLEAARRVGVAVVGAHARPSVEAVSAGAAATTWNSKRRRGSVARRVTSTVVLVGMWPPNHRDWNALTTSWSDATSVKKRIMLTTSERSHPAARSA